MSTTELTKKYNNRFTVLLTTYNKNTFLPTYNFIDNHTKIKHQIKVKENITFNSTDIIEDKIKQIIIDTRDTKINKLLNE